MSKQKITFPHNNILVIPVLLFNIIKSILSYVLYIYYFIILLNSITLCFNEIECIPLRIDTAKK